MKRNLSLLVLACEIAAITILHAVKMNQGAGPRNLEIPNAVSKTTINTNPEIKHFSLLSLK